MKRAEPYWATVVFLKSSDYLYKSFYFKCVSHVCLMSKSTRDPDTMRNFGIFSLSLCLAHSTYLVKYARKLFACSVHFRLLSMIAYTLTYFGPYWIVCFVAKTFASISNVNNENCHQFNLRILVLLFFLTKNCQTTCIIWWHYFRSSIKFAINSRGEFTYYRI